MASRNSHPGDPRPGPSSGSGSRGPSESERRNQEHRRRHSVDYPKTSHQYRRYSTEDPKASQEDRRYSAEYPNASQENRRHSMEHPKTSHKYRRYSTEDPKASQENRRHSVDYPKASHENRRYSMEDSKASHENRRYSAEYPKTSHSGYSGRASTPNQGTLRTTYRSVTTTTKDGKTVQEKSSEKKWNFKVVETEEMKRKKMKEEYEQILAKAPIGEELMERRPETKIVQEWEGEGRRERSQKKAPLMSHHKHFLKSPVKGSTKPTGPNPNEFTAGGYYLRLYKVVYDKDIPNPHVKDSKDFVRRYNGKCGEKYKMLDYKNRPSDPRPSYRKVEQPKNLVVPTFTVDDQYTGIPPKREVTISNLNDNVNKDFLAKMARNQKFDPEDVQVFYHPTTNKHLKMALILFRTSKEARLFVEANNNTKVMGQDFACRLDPFAAELSSMYTAATSANLPKLQYLEGMTEHELSLRREKLIKKNAGATQPPAVEPAATVPPPRVHEERNRSLSPMDTSNSPPYEALPPPPPPIRAYPSQPQQHSHHHHQQPHHHQQQPYDEAGASTSRMASPPPPYSELPPSYPGMYEQRRSEGRTHSTEPESGKSRREKRRHASTSSSSSYSSGEGHGSRHRSDGGVKKKKKKEEEYIKVKRYVSSERDSKGAKVKTEVKEVTYKRRTEQRIEHKSPDSFDEEMRKREAREQSMERRNKRSAETRGRDEMRWGESPSSDSDNGGSRRKRPKEREDHSRDGEWRQPPTDAPPTPHSTPSSSMAPTPSRRKGGFHSAPIFDPSLPPPVIVPPVGLVAPVIAGRVASIPPPGLIPLPLPSSMMFPPPALPGGFVPPPEFFGIPSTPDMIKAAAAAASRMATGGMTPMPPPPPMPPMGGFTPMATFASPAKPPKTPRMLDDTAASISSPLSNTTTSGIVRTTSSSSLTTTARTPAEMRTPVTPSPSDGHSTPSKAATAITAAGAEKKGNLDDRLSQIFGLRKTKKEDDGSSPIKHVASAPSMSSLAVDQMGQDDDMEIDDDDDNMDVASSSSEGPTKTGVIMVDKRLEIQRDTEEERRMKEEAERRAKEKEVDRITAITVDKLIKGLESDVHRDMQRKLDNVCFQMIDDWCKRALNEEDEKKKQMIRETATAMAAARDAKDQLEENLIAKLKSPEGLGSIGISKVISSINIVKKKIIQPEFSRDGTPASRDSRAQSRARSRSRSASRSAESSGDSSSDSDDDEEEEEGVGRSTTTKRHNLRNVESSQESSAASTFESSDSEDEDASEKENRSKRGSPMEDMDVDVTGMSEDEADMIKRELGSASSPYESGPSTSTAAAATADKQLPILAGRGMGAQGRPLTAAAAAAMTAARAGPATGKMPTAVASAVVRRPIKRKADMKKRMEDDDKVSAEVLNLLKTQPAAKMQRPKMIYKKRTTEEEDFIRDSFKAGVDPEDDKYLRLALEEMQKDGARPFGVDREIVYESKLRAYTPLELPVPKKHGKVDLYYDDEDLAGVVPHSAGCARAQGFYRLTFKQKIRIMRNPEAFQDKTEINERDEVVKRHQVQASKEQRSMNRRLQTMVDSNPNSEFFKVNQLKYRKKMIKFARSRIHGWGLYALEPIAPDDMIVEYIGQKIRPIVADEREKQYERRGIGSSYLFRIDEDEVIDATRQGNFARFINHSCQPNCYAKVVTVDGDKRIVIYSKNLINKGDEITYDYKFPLEEDKIECLCGAPACRGTLN